MERVEHIIDGDAASQQIVGEGKMGFPPHPQWWIMKQKLSSKTVTNAKENEERIYWKEPKCSLTRSAIQTIGFSALIMALVTTSGLDYWEEYRPRMKERFIEI